MKDYICEHCFHEQDNNGWCEHCFEQYGATNAVTSMDNINTIPFKDTGSYKPTDADIGFADDYGMSPLTYKLSGKGKVAGGKVKAWTPPPPPPPPRRAKAWKDHNYWFIGDVHGNIAEYQKAIKDIREQDPNAITIQVGDIGIGEYDLPQMGPKDFFIQGNHDSIKACQKHPNFLGKFGYKHGVFYMGGAASKGIGFNGEELSESELHEAVLLYKHVRPEIVVTHDAPETIRGEFGAWGKPKDSRTCKALEEMWQYHNPNVWAFGHFHWGRQDNIEGTEFICVAPLESHQIRLAWTTGEQEYQKISKPMEMTKGEAITKWFKNMAGM